MLTYDDVLEAVILRMREVAAHDEGEITTLTLEEIITLIIPETKMLLGQVYATSAYYLDQADEDGGKVSELIKHNLRVRLANDVLKRQREIQNPQEYSDNVVKGIFGGDPWKT